MKIFNIINRGVFAWILSLFLITFYILLYWDRELDALNWQKDLAPLNQQISSAKKLVTSSSDENLQESKENLINLKAQLKLVKKSILYYKQGTFAVTDKFNLTLDNQAIAEKLQGKISYQKLTASVYSLLNPMAYVLRGKKADKWFLYGFIYTFLIVVMGIRFIRKWSNNQYQKLRTLSVMFFQSIISFIVPNLLLLANTKEFYFSYFWPLKFDYFAPAFVQNYPRAMILWALGMSFIAVPILTYKFGKRWYCSWVCGCGALANTLGDPFRHLSSKSTNSWKLEKISIYSVLVLAVTTTIILFVNQARGVHDSFSEFAFSLQKWYMFFIAAGFAGVVGTGFYPIAGTRVWCRFGCPQAAILGIIQRFKSNYRITINGDQCMSCGNCSTYCEMGIDVRMYAMTGRDFARASCVGCGLCEAVCPRGVLKLENISGSRANVTCEF